MVENYIKSLTKEDIKFFSQKQNIDLNEDEINIVYNTIKSDYKTLLYGNYNKIFTNLKSRINPTSYNKIIILFKEYKEKYYKYL